MVEVETFRNVIDIDNNPVNKQSTDLPEYVHMVVYETTNANYGNGNFVFSFLSPPSPPSGSNSAIVEGKVTPAYTLWIYGDSVSQRFLASLQSRQICKKHFQKCTSSYMWVYEV